MGLRTASVRHPHVEVMAPALTETNQSQSFKLPPNQLASPVNGVDKSGELYVPRKATTSKDLNYGFGNPLSLAIELLKIDQVNRALDSTVEECAEPIMSNCPQPMGDQDDKMGLQKGGLEDVTCILKDRLDTEDDQLFNINNINPNVDELMQVFKSLEAESTGSVQDEQDVIFPLSGSDLNVGNFTNLEKELFSDVMNMSMEEQLSDSVTNIKETQTKDLMTGILKQHSALDRRMDFLIRRVRKFQSRLMGQHVSGEMAGVYEHVHRTLKKCKEQQQHQQPMNCPKQDDSAVLNHLPEEPKPVIQEKLKPISYNSTKNLIKKLEMSAVVQANNTLRQRHTNKYFGAGSVEPTTGYRSTPSMGLTTLAQWPQSDKQELQRVSGFLESEMSMVQNEVDSEATVSSSGGESCDEMQTYNNPHQQYLPIHKRAAWRYAKDRAAIASRWTWLQSQVADLDYKIRQYNDLHKKIRASKESVRLGGASPSHVSTVPSSPTCVNGYRGQLPGASPTSKGVQGQGLDAQANGACGVSSGGGGGGGATPSPDVQCSRTRPLVSFRKRKLLQITGLHAVSKKAARPSTVRCGCVPPDITCALCTGRTDPTHPRDVTDYLSKNEKLALLDPSFHPTFSLNEDASAMLHMEAIMKTSEWQQRSSRANLKAMKFLKSDRTEKAGSSIEHRPRKLEHRKKHNRHLKPTTVNALSAKIKNRNRKNVRPTGKLKKRNRMSSSHHSIGSDGIDEEIESLGVSGGGKFDSPSTSPLLTAQSISSHQKRNRVDSYDIDNIIIPYSVAASTRVEKLQYKEILTPKWRIVESNLLNKYDVKNNGTVKTSQGIRDGEDMSEDAVLARHEKSEQDEKKKFLSYLKLPIGYGRSRANRRTDSRAESSGANTPDPMSPAPVLGVAENSENTVSPLTSPPATPLPMDDPIPTLPTISALRRRTISQSRVAKDKESLYREENRCSTPEQIEEPYEKRLFPLNEEMYEKMLRSMPDEHKLKTNARSQEVASPSSESDEKLIFHDSESTESAYGEEDPNDPEWDVETVKERFR
ncbi:PREDICTED: KAT8 regulatory NSL complex subunit 1 [Nicrophorus vespilloides]|uniref:KAT8 regulatory NSL complex subunit 1 n=1 Tax=Nicrophorus vespilloides TaxID=110193 RepID=A0ABM1MA03_NICVS|nr:PREDICTED: KAT8 regulatory NSL complex subunit 1 [Nicrophorus vespilloides]